EATSARRKCRRRDQPVISPRPYARAREGKALLAQARRGRGPSYEVRRQDQGRGSHEEAEQEERREAVLIESARWLTFIETLKIRRRDRKIANLRYNEPQRAVWEKVKDKIDRH